MPRPAARRSTALAYAAMFAVVAAPCITRAQDYPNRPIRLIVPYPPGEMRAADASMLVNSVKNDDLRLFDPLT